MDALRSLELTCLGPPTARLAGESAPPEVLWKRHIALLSYLALSPGRTRTRDHLMGLLWPERPQEKARHSLNEAVRKLRGSLGADRLITTADRLTLNETGLHIDVADLEQMATEDGAELSTLVRGEFLEGVHIEDAQPFTDWLSAERRRVGELAVNVCRASSALALASGDTARAAELGRRALLIQPHSEVAVTLLMRALALGGDSAAALAACHDFVRQLARDLDEEPSEELRALADRVRQGDWRRDGDGDRMPEPRRVGRERLHRMLFEAVETSDRRAPFCVAIAGEPGTGKTRLLKESIERLALMGAHVSEARLIESDHDGPWSTLRTLMRAGLASAPGVAAVDPRALGVLAGKVPELAERFDPVETQDHAEVGDAFAVFLSAIAEEQPVALAIDEAQWADEATVTALGHACRVLKDSPLFLITTAGSEGRAPAPYPKFVERIGRDYEGLVAKLEPFSLEETRELVEEMATWCTDDDERGRLTRRVALETGGNPFLAVTLLRDLDKATRLREDLLVWPAEGSTFDAPLPFSIPSMVRIALLARIARLSKDAQRFVRAASITGVSIDTELVTVMAELDTQSVNGVLDELELHGLITHAAGRYVFAGRFLPEVIVAECIVGGEQRRLRMRALEFLESRSDLASSALRMDLLAASADYEQAFASALSVITDATAVGALRTARRALASAEDAASHVESVDVGQLDDYRQRLS